LAPFRAFASILRPNASKQTVFQRLWRTMISAMRLKPYKKWICTACLMVRDWRQTLDEPNTVRLFVKDSNAWIISASFCTNGRSKKTSLLSKKSMILMLFARAHHLDSIRSSLCVFFCLSLFIFLCYFPLLFF